MFNFQSYFWKYNKNIHIWVTFETIDFKMS